MRRNGPVCDAQPYDSSETTPSFYPMRWHAVVNEPDGAATSGWLNHRPATLHPLQRQSAPEHRSGPEPADANGTPHIRRQSRAFGS